MMDLSKLCTSHLHQVTLLSSFTFHIKKALAYLPFSNHTSHRNHQVEHLPFCEELTWQHQGITTLFKQKHPSWSPSAIHSALVTSAFLVENKGGLLLAQSPVSNSPVTIGPGSPFDLGMEAANPTSATDPALVFETGSFLPGCHYHCQKCKRVMHCFSLNKFSRDRGFRNLTQLFTDGRLE
jgi:hypothetical protein